MSYYSSDAKCPFYQHDNIQACTITCEGVLPGSTMKSHFDNRAALRGQIQKYCAGDYEVCPWYKVASMKWQ